MRRRRLMLAPLGAVAGLMPGLWSGAAQAQAAPGFFDGLALVRHDGRPFDAAQLKGKTLLVNFAFTTCSTTCPTTLLQLERLRQRLASQGPHEIELVTVSADPLHDTPATLRQYAARLGLKLERWQWLTGQPGPVHTLMERLTGQPGPKNDPLAHPTALNLVDALGRRIARFHGVEMDLPRLERELLNLDRTVGAKARAGLSAKAPQ